MSSNSSPMLPGLELRTTWLARSQAEVLVSVRRLITLHRAGQLGGETMPEDARPELDRGSSDNFHYFTLCMALNYQRNSYSLWKAATKAYDDQAAQWVFVPNEVMRRSIDELRESLVRHRVALQPQRHVSTWRTLCESLVDLCDGDVRLLLSGAGHDVCRIRTLMQQEHKRRFPYLSGEKIFNYWLHVLERYTDTVLRNRQEISVAPDTHVLQASVALGLISPEDIEKPNARVIVSERWKEILATTEMVPIDIHTPMWLWSRGGFLSRAEVLC